MKHLTITRNKSSTNKRGIIRVPSEGKFLYAVQDIYSGEWFDQNGRPCPRAVTRNYKNPPNDALPSTIQMWGAMKIGEFFPLTEAWQKLWLDLIDRATDYTLYKEWLPYKQLTPAHLLYWWAYATQESLALTDNHSALYHGEILENGYADYMLKLNVTNPKPIAIKSLSMTGNIFKEIGRSGNKIVVETINAGYLDCNDKLVIVDPPKIDDIWGKPWLVHWAVESTTSKLADGSYAQTAFPPKPYGLPFPVLGIDGRNTISANRVVPIENGSLFSPYHPMEL